MKVHQLIKFIIENNISPQADLGYSLALDFDPNIHGVDRIRQIKLLEDSSVRSVGCIVNPGSSSIVLYYGEDF